MTRDQESAWREAVNAERERRRAAAQSADPAKVREWWASIADLLELTKRLSLQGETPPHAGDVMHVLGVMARDLAAGRLPDFVRDATTEGAPAMSALEAHDVGFAVAYRLAAGSDGFERDGQVIRISDRSPVKALCEWFGVERTTVQGWVTRIKAPMLPPGPLDADALIARTKAAGARYRSAGRAASAIRRRSGC